MATVTYLRNVRFNNPALPKIWPFAIDSYVSEGLVFAVQPQHNITSMLDLSGNGTTFTPLGTDISFTNQGVMTRGGLGMFVTNRLETEEWTGILVYRMYKIGPSWQIPASLLLSCYHSSGTGGTAGYVAGEEDETDSLALHKMQSAVNSVSTPGALSNHVAIPTEEVPRFAHNAPTSAWVFFAAGVGNSSPKCWYVVRNQNMNARMDQDYYNPQGRLDLYSPHPWGIGGPGGSQSGFSSMRAEIACVALWDRSLSVNELQRQYEMTQAFCMDRGILI